MKAHSGKENAMPVMVECAGVRHVFLVGREWKRYVYHIKEVKSASMNRFSIEMRSPGNLWVDAVQIEQGEEATPFTPHPDDGKKTYENVGAVVVNENVPQAAPVRATGPVTLDGKLDEKAWEAAPRITDFKSDGKPVSIRTEARLLYDDENLYVAVRCYDDDMKNLVAEQTERDGKTFMDDSVEIFFDANRDGRTYFTFCTNVLGTRTDGIGFDYSWNGQWEAKASRGDDAWTVEIRFPLANFDISPSTPAVWGMNIGREHPRLKQYPCWAPTKGVNFHQPVNFSKLVWKEPGIFKKFFFSFQDIQLLAVPGAKGKASLTGAVKNNTGRDVKGRVRLIADGRTFESDLFEMTAGKAIPFEIAHLKLPSDKPLALLVQVVTAEGKLRRSTSLTRKVLPPVDVFVDRSYYSIEPDANLVCDVNVPPKEAKGLRARLTLEAGKKVLWRGTYPLGPGRKMLPVPVSQLKAGFYTVKAVFAGASGKAIAETDVELRKVDYKKGETKIDRVARIMLKDGSPYIPFMNLMGGYTPPGEATVRMYRDAGFGALMLGFPWHRREFSEEMATETMKLLEKYSLDYFIFYCPRFKKDGTYEDLPGRERRIRRIGRERPGILGWLVMDEPWDHPKRTIAAIKNAKTWDPNRVVYANHHIPMVLKRFAGLPGDAVSTDHYVSAMPMRRIENVARYTRQFERIAAELHVPTWFFISGGSGYYAAREGTPGELTAQVYGHLAAGGNGLFTFIGDFIAPATWKRLVQLNRELKYLTPVIASRGLERVQQVPDPAPEIITGTWRHNGAYYIIAASQSNRAIDARFDLGSLQLGRAVHAEVLFEGRSVGIVEFSIKDRFGPYERHVYRIIP